MDRDEFYSNLEYYASLRHSGIVGMKWGVKNGPPYPLKEAMKSAAEKRAATKQERFNKAKEKAKVRGNLNWAIKHADSLTNDEIKDILNRQGVLSDLLKRRASYEQEGKKAVTALSNFLNSTKSLSASGIDAYNNVARILELMGFDVQFIYDKPKRPDSKSKSDDDKEG